MSLGETGHGQVLLDPGRSGLRKGAEPTTAWLHRLEFVCISGQGGRITPADSYHLPPFPNIFPKRGSMLY
jgi:hypothetical protein